MCPWRGRLGWSSIAEQGTWWPAPAIPRPNRAPASRARCAAADIRNGCECCAMLPTGPGRALQLLSTGCLGPAPMQDAPTICRGSPHLGRGAWNRCSGLCPSRGTRQRRPPTPSTDARRRRGRRRIAVRRKRPGAAARVRLMSQPKAPASCCKEWVPAWQHFCRGSDPKPTPEPGACVRRHPHGSLHTHCGRFAP